MFDELKLLKLSGILPNKGGNEHNKRHNKNCKNIMTDAPAHKPKHIKHKVHHGNINPQQIKQQTGHKIAHFKSFGLGLIRLLLLFGEEWSGLLLGKTF
jgi:hypothetical protein